MQETKDFLEFDKPLRECYLNLSDEQFKIVMAGLTETELKILKLVYGEEYLVVNNVQLRENEIKLFINALKEKIPRRVNLVFLNSQRCEKRRQNNEKNLKRTNENFKSAPKNIFAYFEKYEKRQVLRAILRLKPTDYLFLRSLCNNNLMNPIDIRGYHNFHSDLYYKIQRRILCPERYPVRIIGNTEKEVLNEETRVSILNFLDSPIYQELLSVFSGEEAIFYAMQKGLIDDIKFNTDMIMAVLDLEEIEISDLSRDISLKTQTKMGARILNH